MKKYTVVTNIENIDKKKWNKFIKNHVNGNIFQTPEIYNVYQNINNYEPLVIIILNNVNDILGLQVSVKIRLYSNIIGSLTTRSIIFGGPLVFNNDKEILDIILTEYLKRIKNKAIVSQFRNMWDWKSLKSEFFSKNIYYEDHLDILLNLTKGEDQLRSEMKRARRKNIKQSYKKDIVIKKINIADEDQLQKAYAIIKCVYKRIKLPLHDINYFRQFRKYFPNELLSLGLFIKDELVAVRLALCFNGVVYDWYAGAKDEFLYCRPNDVLPWELMRWGILNNFKTFDFGGAGKPSVPYGVRDHKLKFGGELVNFGRFEIIHKPFLMKIAKTGLMIKQKIS